MAETLDSIRRAADDVLIGSLPPSLLASIRRVVELGGTLAETKRRARRGGARPMVLLGIEAAWERIVAERGK